MEVNVVFPDEYYEEVAGKEARFEVHVSKVQAYDTSVWNDEYVKQNTDYESQEDMENSIRNDLESTAQSDATSNWEYDLIQEVLNGSEFQIEESDKDLYVDQMMSEYESYAAAANKMCIRDRVYIDNLPDVRDINALLEALDGIGAHVKRVNRHAVEINGSGVENCIVENESMKKIRASYYLLGALLGKYKRAEVPLPGGCNIGSRPIDQHLKGFKAMGAVTRIEHGFIKMCIRDRAKTQDSELGQSFPGIFVSAFA